MSTEAEPQSGSSGQHGTSTEATVSAEAPAQQQEEEEEARYASQAVAAQPSPVAFEGGGAAPDESSRGTTGREEWIFLLLAVLFSLVLVAVPAVFFTSIDLTAAGNAGGAPPEEEAREIERLQLLQETRADALSKLYTYGPVEGGTFRVPIKRAMRLTVRQDTSASAPAAGRPAGGDLAAPPGSALESMTPR